MKFLDALKGWIPRRDEPETIMGGNQHLISAAGRTFLVDESRTNPDGSVYTEDITPANGVPIISAAPVQPEDQLLNMNDTGQNGVYENAWKMDLTTRYSDIRESLKGVHGGILGPHEFYEQFMPFLEVTREGIVACFDPRNDHVPTSVLLPDHESDAETILDLSPDAYDPFGDTDDDLPVVTGEIDPFITGEMTVKVPRYKSD